VKRKGLRGVQVKVSGKYKTIDDLIKESEEDPRLSSTTYEKVIEAVREKYKDPEEASKRVRELWESYGIPAKGLWGVRKKGVIITSKAAHYSVFKAAEALGIARAQGESYLRISAIRNS
jgi:hypothetical protein